MDDREQRERDRKAKHAERERERYRKSREAGLTRRETRNLKQTVSDRPDLVPLLGDISAKLSSLIDSIVDTTVKTLDKVTGELVPQDLKKVRFKTSTPKPKKTEREKQLNRQAGQFKKFMKKNPSLTGRQAADAWRKKGHPISSQRAADLAREAKGKKRNTKKVNRYPTIPWGTATTHLYLKERYNYVMSFLVEVSGKDDPERRYLTITSPTRLNKRERTDAVLMAFAQGEADANEWYTAVYIYPESIETEYLIDRDKKAKDFDVLADRMRAADPAVKLSAVVAEYRKIKRDKEKRKK